VTAGSETLNLSSATAELASYAARLHYADLPDRVVRLAKYCLIDAAACAIHGSSKPWSRMIEDYAEASSGEGTCLLPGALKRAMPPAQAALCLGAFAHAFELDCLRKPGAGVHPGATVALPALMMAQAMGSSGRELVGAIVAGCETMFRIGNATLHTPESVGFHAPGITGPFGAAAATGLLLGLDAKQMANAFGLAASMTGGILNFAKSREGGMVKRLHLGRAAEAGTMAALLARRGFEAPTQVLEGPFGILDVFCVRSDASLLTKDIGKTYEIEKLCFKRYACHATAQVPIQLLRDLMEQHGFDGGAIKSLSLSVSDKVLSHHADTRPVDLMLAQYSVPFSLAVSAFRDPEDPQSFSDEILADEAITGLAGRIGLEGGRSKGWGAAIIVHLADGRRFSQESNSFRGCPETPFSFADLERKFYRLTASADRETMSRLLSTIRDIELTDDCATLFS
jgi:2-methylcitrate dehydratase PrpD